jgi:hypothetical protein
VSPDFSVTSRQPCHCEERSDAAIFFWSLFGFWLWRSGWGLGRCFGWVVCPVEDETEVGGMSGVDCRVASLLAMTGSSGLWVAEMAASALVLRMPLLSEQPIGRASLLGVFLQQFPAKRILTRNNKLGTKRKTQNFFNILEVSSTTKIPDPILCELCALCG